MYSVDDQDQVISLDDVPPQSTGAPLPVIVATDNRLLVSYLTGHDSEERVMLQFKGARAHCFGPPNDEALSGHPLASMGLRPYGAFEVLGSSWVRKLERMNRVHPRHDSARFAGLRHFVLTFHDGTFECIASDVGVVAEAPHRSTTD